MASGALRCPALLSTRRLVFTIDVTSLLKPERTDIVLEEGGRPGIRVGNRWSGRGLLPIEKDAGVRVGEQTLPRLAYVPLMGWP